MAPAPPRWSHAAGAQRAFAGQRAHTVINSVHHLNTPRIDVPAGRRHTAVMSDTMISIGMHQRRHDGA